MLWPFPFNHYPGTDYETFNWDWLISTVKRLQTTVDNWVNDIKDYVLEILSDHPEWIQNWMLDDGSVTNSKFADEVFWYVTPEMFGAKGDGVTDDTDALQAMLDSNYHAFKLNQKTYITTKPLVINDGRKHIEGLGHDSVIKKVGQQNLGNYMFTVNEETFDISAIDAVIIYCPPNGYNGDDSIITWYDYISDVDIQRTAQDATGYGVAYYFRGFPEMQNVKIHKTGKPLTMTKCYGGHFNNITSLDAMTSTLSFDRTTSTTFSDAMLSTLGGDYNIYADNSQLQFTNTIIDFGLIRARNNSILEFSNLRTECHADIAHAESGSYVNILGGNIEYHYDPGVTVNALFIANGGVLTVQDAAIRYQNYSGSSDPENIKLYSAYNTGYIRLDAEFKNFPEFTHELQAGSEAFVNKINQLTGANPTINNAVTVSYANVDADNINGSHVKRVGGHISIHLHLHLNVGTATWSDLVIARLPSELAPANMIRSVAWTGTELYDCVHTSVCNITTSGAIVINPRTANDRYVVFHAEYELPWYID